MICSLMDWRRVLRRMVWGLSLAAMPATSLAQNAPDATAAQEVDPAAKQLMAANGLFQRGLFKLAATGYSQFLADHPEHAQANAARYAQGVCQMRLGEHAAAIQSLSPVVRDEQFAQRDEALAVLGYCQLVSKHYEPAQAAFAELLSKYPHSRQAESAACYQVQALYLGASAKQAAEAAENFLRDYPHSDKRATALYFQALSYKSLREHDKVIASAKLLNRDFPESPYRTDAWLLSGQSCEALNKLDAAIEQYRGMLEAAPEARKADAHYSLGIALYRSGQYDSAARELEAVTQDSPQSAYAKAAWLHLGLARLAGNHIPEAHEALEQVVRNDPSRAADAQYALSQCDIAEKQFERAYRTLDELARGKPAPANLPQILIDRAVCLMETGKYQQAADEFEEFRRQFSQAPQVAEAMYRQAFCLHKLAHYDQSHAICESLAGLSPGEMTRPAAELDAENLFLLGKYPDAGKAFAALADSAKDAARQLQFTLRRGQCEYFAGNYAKAADLLGPLAGDSRTADSPDLRQAIFLYGDSLLQQGKFAEASQPLQRFIELKQGDTREAKFKLARAQLGAGQKDPARRTLAELAEGPADSPWVLRGLLELGQLQYKAAEPGPAAASLNRIVRADAPPELAAPAFYLLGWIDYDAKRFAEAAEHWKKLIDAYPKHALAADAEFQRAIALKEAGKFDEALSAFQAFAANHSENPNAAKARQLAASVLTAQGHDDQAEQMLAQLAASSQAPDTVLYDLAWSQRNMKNLGAARETYRKFLSNHSDSKLAAAVRTELAELVYDDKNYAEAADLLEKVVSDSSVDLKVLAPASYRLGFCYARQNKWPQAAAQFNRFAERFADDPKLAASALMQAGISSAEEGKFDQAEASLARLVGKYADSEQAPLALLKLGEAQAEQQEFTRSLQTYRDFLDRHDKSEFAYRAQFGAGWALENLKKYDEARDAYKKVIAATNGETAARAQFQIGETYLAEKNFEQAATALLAVEDVYAYPAWGARALYEAGRAFEQLRQPERAKEQYTQLVAKYKSAPEAEMAQERIKAL